MCNPTIEYTCHVIVQQVEKDQHYQLQKLLCHPTIEYTCHVIVEQVGND